jgi:hypothetical protein
MHCCIRVDSGEAGEAVVVTLFLKLHLLSLSSPNKRSSITKPFICSLVRE